jgi:hypothetical protein
MGLTPHASWLRWDDAIRELIVDSFELGTSSLIVGQRAKEKAVQREGRPAAILFGRCDRGWLYLEPDETVLISSFGAGKLDVMAESPLKLIERIPRLAGSMRAPLRLRLSPLCGARLAEALALPVAAEASDSVQTLWEKDGTLVVDEGLGDARSRSTTLAASTSGQLAAALRAVAGVEAVRVHIDTQTKENRLPVGEAPEVPKPGPEESLRLPVGFELEPVGGVVRLLGQGKNMEVEQLEEARGGVIGRLVVRGRRVISERFDVDAQPFKGAISEKAEKKLARKARVDLRLRASEARLREILGVRAFPPVLALEERFGGLTLSGEQEGEALVFGVYAYRNADPTRFDEEVVASNGERVVPVGYDGMGAYYLDAKGSLYFQDEVALAHPARIAASIEKHLERLGHELPKGRTAVQIACHGAWGARLAKALKARRDETLSDDAEQWWMSPRFAVREWDNIFEGHRATSLFAADSAPLLEALDAVRSELGPSAVSSPQKDVIDALKQRGFSVKAY